MRFMTYANPMPVSGSAKPKDPPAPGVPNALFDEPKTNFEKGLMKPSENMVSRCNTLSRNPFIGGNAGVANTLSTPGRAVTAPSTAAEVRHCSCHDGQRRNRHLQRHVNQVRHRTRHMIGVESRL